MAIGLKDENGQPWIVDGDGHVREPQSFYDDYVPEEYKSYQPTREVDDGLARWVVGPVRGAPKTAQIAPRNTGGKDSTPLPELRGEWDAAARIEDMAIDGISHAVLFPTEAMMFGCVEDRAAASALSRAYNDWLGAYCDVDREHLLHVAHIPFANPDDAVEELRRCHSEYGSVGAYVRPNPYPPYPPGRFARDETNEPFWAAAEELGVAVCFHEACLCVVPTPGVDRFGPDEYLLVHTGAHPMGMMMAMLETIGTGVVERHPGLRIGYLEAGCGWVPAWLDRFDEHVEEWAGGDRFRDPPSEQFRHQCFVSTEGDEVGLKLCADMYPGNIIFASDYPHADCTFPGSSLPLIEHGELTDEQKERILRGNSIDWFGLRTPVSAGT